MMSPGALSLTTGSIKLPTFSPVRQGTGNDLLLAGRAHSFLTEGPGFNLLAQEPGKQLPIRVANVT